MTLTSLNRWKAASFHLALSAAIGATVVALMLVFWYPQPYFVAMGGDTLILILIGVDVVIGPLITLVVFDPKKKHLRFDLAVIALLQLSALAYGCHVMFVARPVYTVFVVDRFEAVAANQIDAASLAKATAPEFRALPLAGPQVIAVRQPDDPQRQAEIVMSAMAGGADLANLPEFYVPYAAFQRDAAARALPLAELLRRQPDGAEAIRTLLAATRRGADTVGYVPLRARNRDMSVLVDRKTGEVVGIVAVYPW
jgi:hypothetical protein